MHLEPMKIQLKVGWRDIYKFWVQINTVIYRTVAI